LVVIAVAAPSIAWTTTRSATNVFATLWSKDLAPTPRV
jgi:hypothetical protein